MRQQHWQYIQHLQFSNNCEILVFDEAHKALAKTYKFLVEDITRNSKNCRLLGLTATPGRGKEDEFENKKLANLFSNNLIRCEFEKQDASYKLCYEAIDFWFNENVRAECKLIA